MMRVLVVDDSVSARKLVKSQLVKVGYEVEMAASGEEALNIIESQPCFNLITLDLNMEGMDGFDTCLSIRSLPDPKKSETPVIFIAGNDSMELRARGFEVGASDFLSKENLAVSISQTVDHILRPDQVLNLCALVIDDSEVVRRSMVSDLRQVFSIVHQAKDGLEAFEMIQSDIERYSFIIADQNMPNMTGTELTKKVRFDLGLKDIPIVLLTGSSDRSKVLEFFGSGGTDCLIKPYIKEELLGRIRAHIDKAELNTALKDHIEVLKTMSDQKDDYLAACSHDLKTPLNAIIGFTQLVAEDIDDELAKEDLRKVVEAANILHDLIGNITDLYRVQSEEVELEFDPINLNDLVNECLELNQALAERKGVQLIFKPFSILPPVLGNSLALKRVINNLMSNALKFTEKGGKIEVKLKSKMTNVVVSIIDSGIGMSKDVQDKLFKKFSKASKDGTGGEKGTGLGLMITQQIVEQHGGEIQVTSQEGKGSEFSFNLQFAQQKAA